VSQKPVTLRCPSCNAQVNVAFRHDFADCRLCGHRWQWKLSPKRVTLEVGR
jgi:DNA-directed RNA polymerase subunit RPC12/RpoP